jgi:fission process protein 1
MEPAPVPAVTAVAVAADVDVFRDTPVRYLGYTNELGESFKAFIGRRVYLGSYAVACVYCLGDATTRGWRAREEGRPALEVFDTTTEALVWQGFASVALPGLVINRVVATYTHLATAAAPRFPALMARLPPQIQATVVGLACIPLIISPIDRAVDIAMATVYRPVASAAFGTPNN